MTFTGEKFDAGQFWINQNDYETPGEAIEWHVHDNAHTTIVTIGKCRISLKREDGRIETFDHGPGDRAVQVPAAAQHRIECLEAPARSQCLFLHRDHTGRIIDHYVGYQAAYR